MSHELRTPLNAIIGFSEIMASGMFGPLGADQLPRNIAATFTSSGQYLLDVINDVLDMSRIEAGRFKLAPEDVELESMLSDACAWSPPAPRTRRLTVIRRSPRRHPPARRPARASSRSRSICSPTR